MNFTRNITETDRFTHILTGAVLIYAALVNASKLFDITVGLGIWLVIHGLIGRMRIPLTENAMKFDDKIDKIDRINRIIIGVALGLAALVSASKLFYIALGFILVIEGLMGWCLISHFFNKYFEKNKSRLY